MNRDFRVILNQIDEFLAVGDDNARALFDILSALRGPDRPEDAHLKSSTTAVVRTWALPKTAAVNNNNNDMRICAQFALPLSQLNPDIDSWSGHFAMHLVYARNALKWDNAL